jgi:glycosyltransferase involved in cell wall biosynthesis
MRICIVTTAFPRWKDDGRGSFVFEAAKALHHQGHQIRIVAMHNPGARQRENWGGIDIFRPRYLPDRWEILQKDSAGLPQAWKSNPWSKLAIIPFLIVHSFAVARWARGQDIIHANWTLSAAVVWMTQWFHRRPYVVTVQGSDIFQAAQKPFLRLITRIVLMNAGKVIALSHALAEAVLQLKIKADKVCIIPNGVNIDQFNFDPAVKREPLILYVGSLISRKGVDFLLQAFSMLADVLPNVRLAFVGEGNLRPFLEETARAQKISDRVIFPGSQTQIQVQDWMRKASVFVLPSIEEGQGVVLLEALASGTPCIGSRVGGISDVITPDVGILVEPGQPKELQQAILEIIHSAQWESLSIQARRRAEKEFDWKQIAVKISVVYHQVFAEAV